MYSNNLRLLHLVFISSHFIFYHKSNQLPPLWLLLWYNAQRLQKLMNTSHSNTLLPYYPHIQRLHLFFAITLPSHVIILVCLIPSSHEASGGLKSFHQLLSEPVFFWLCRERAGGLPEHRRPHSEGEGSGGFQVWGVRWEREGNLV